VSSLEPASSPPASGASRWLLPAALGVGSLDCAYLTWRFVALQAGWVEPGTGLCSWTAWVDCDQVLSTPEARAFYVPNAVLGWAFFSGASLWWWGSRRFPEAARGWAERALTLWLGIATLLTFLFIYLMTQISAFCPFCPWNHLWTWIAFGAGVAGLRSAPPLDPGWREHRARLARWVAGCVSWCLAWLAAWLALTAFGTFGSGGPPPLWGS
jgi:uncharacterized membrane protein